MKIKYFGTAAYEGVPALFCNCRVCRESKRLGGKNLRSRAQALINDELLMDFNADTVCHYLQYGFDWDKITACLITHSHCDHLYPDDIEIAADAYSHNHGKLHFYAARSGYKTMKPFTDKTDDNATVTLVEAGKRFQAGEYSVCRCGRITILRLRPFFIRLRKAASVCFMRTIRVISRKKAGNR